MYAVTTPIWWYASGGTSMNVPDAGLGSFLLVGVLLALHGVFLLPLARPGTGPSRSLTGSALVGSLLVGLLVGAGVLGVGQLLYTYAGFDPGIEGVWIGVGLGVGVGWLFSTPLVLGFVRRGRRENTLARLSARLFMGTVLEAAALIPIDVMVRRKEDCVCATGTYIGLVVCATVGLFTIGPAVFLPLLSRRRRRWYANRCETCGYDMRSLPGAERCPECGSGWRA